MEWFKEFLQELIYVGSDGEHTEIQKTFFAILGNLSFKARRPLPQRSREGMNRIM